VARLCHKPIYDECKLRYGCWLGHPVIKSFAFEA